MKTGDYRAARASFEQALRYSDSAFDVHLGLGVAYFHLQDDKYAERELSKAAEINPKTSAAYQYLGELCYRKDDLETAAMYWGKAVGLPPADSVRGGSVVPSSRPLWHSWPRFVRAGIS